jgi:hypothetical protein
MACVLFLVIWMMTVNLMVLATSPCWVKWP